MLSYLITKLWSEYSQVNEYSEHAAKGRTPKRNGIEGLY